MNLMKLIERLQKADKNRIVPMGFNNPHSHRGDYCQLAFEPAINIKVEEMLKCAEDSLGETFTGYKGGEFNMHEYTECFIANYGECGEEISEILLDYMLGVYDDQV